MNMEKYLLNGEQAMEHKFNLETLSIPPNPSAKVKIVCICGEMVRVVPASLMKGLKKRFTRVTWGDLIHVWKGQDR